MADIADITTERAEAEAPYLLAATRRPVPPAPNGQCLYCDAELPKETENRRFCDTDCARDWQHLQDRMRANGE